MMHFPHYVEKTRLLKLLSLSLSLTFDLDKDQQHLIFL